MSSHYKLTYFNLRARAEISRIIFAVAGVKYEDHRISDEEWKALKPDTPFGQIPVLTVDGITLCQGYAIARFLANRFKLSGKTDLEKARADMIVDCVEDSILPVFKFFFEADAVIKAELLKKYVEVQLPGYFESFEKILKKNKGGDGYFVGDGLTWADLMVFNFYDLLSGVDKKEVFEGVLNKFPKLKALVDRVSKVPQVADWVAKRPVTSI